MVIHDDEKCQLYDNMLNFQVGAWPIKYLGVPVSAIRLHVEDWVPTEEGMYKRLDG